MMVAVALHAPVCTCCTWCPDQIQLTLDEHQAVLDAKAKELADMIGEVSIKTVDTSDFDEGSMRNKSDVQEKGYMGGKVQ